MLVGILLRRQHLDKLRLRLMNETHDSVAVDSGRHVKPPSELGSRGEVCRRSRIEQLGQSQGVTEGQEPAEGIAHWWNRDIWAEPRGDGRWGNVDLRASMSLAKGGRAIIQIGEAAPAFVLADEMGEPVSLPGGAPTVLVFYRGDW
jgi:hypothetical protein